MKRVYFIIAFLVFAFVAPQAHAAEARAVAKINLRAGPDGGYPIVDILKRNERVELLGCIDGYQWCEVESMSGERGWVYSHYLNTAHRGETVTIIQNGGNLRIITFRPNNYWDTYYRNKYFYRDRYKWIPRDSGNHNDNDHHPHDNNDDDNHHGHQGTRPAPQPKPVEELKYKPMEMPSRKKYNPLCPMGENEC